MGLFSFVKDTVKDIFVSKENRLEKNPLLPVPKIPDSVYNFAKNKVKQATNSSLFESIKSKQSSPFDIPLESKVRIGASIFTKDYKKAAVDGTVGLFDKLHEKNPVVTRTALSLTRMISDGTNLLLKLNDINETSKEERPFLREAINIFLPTKPPILPKTDRQKQDDKVFREKLIDLSNRGGTTVEGWQKKYGYKTTEDYQNASMWQKVSSPKYIPQTLQVIGPDIIASMIPFLGQAGLTAKGTSLLAKPTLSLAERKALPYATRFQMKLAEKSAETFSPAQIFLGTSIAGSVAKEAEENGVSREQSVVTGLLVAVPSMYFEGVVPNNILKPSVRGDFIKGFTQNVYRAGFNVAKSGAKEGLTEGGQTVIELIAKSTYREVTGQEMSDDLLMSVFGGVVGGSGMDASVKIYDLARTGQLKNMSAGLSIKEVTDEEAAQIKAKFLKDRSEFEQSQLDTYNQQIQDKGNFGFLDDKLDVEFQEYMFYEPDPTEGEFVDFEMENNYQSFLSVIKKPQLRNPKAREAILSSDVVRFQNELEARGIMSKFGSDALLYDRDKTNGEVFESFISRTQKENASLLSTKIVAARLHVEDDSNIQLFKQRKLELEKEMAEDTDTLESVKTKLREEISNVSEEVAVVMAPLVEAVETHQDAVDVVNVLKAQARRAKLDAKATEALTKKLLKTAEKINRVATKSELQTAIQANTEVAKSDFVRRRESTLLKDRIRNYIRGTRRSAIMERNTSQDHRAALRAIVQQSELSVAQKRRLLTMREFTEVTSLTDLESKMEALMERVDSVTADFNKRALVKKLADAKKEGKYVTGERPKGKLEAETQALMDWAYGENTGFNMYTVTRNAKGRVTSIDTSAALYEIEVRKNKLLDPTQRLKAEDKYVLQFEVAVLSVAGVFEGRIGRADISSRDIQIALGHINNLVDTAKGSRLETAIKEDAEFVETIKSVHQEINAGEMVGSGVFDKETKRNKKRGKPAKIFAGAKSFFDNISNLDNLLDKTINKANIKGGNSYRESAIYNKVAKFFHIGRRAELEKNFEMDRQLNNALRDIYLGDSQAVLESKMWGGRKIKNAMQKLLTEMYVEQDLGEFTLAPDPLLGGKQEVETIQLTKINMIDVYAQSQDPIARAILLKGKLYTEEIIAAVEAKLSPQDKQYADYLLDVYYPQMAEYFAPHYEKETGVPLTSGRLGGRYYPITVDVNTIPHSVDQKSGIRQFDVDLWKGFSTTSRIKSARQLEEIMNAEYRMPVPIIMDPFHRAKLYTMEITRSVELTDPVRNMQKVFATDEIKYSIVKERGLDFYNQISAMLESISEKTASGVNGADLKWVDSLTGNFAKAKLTANVTQFPKQVTSSIMWSTVANSYRNISGMYAMQAKMFASPKKVWFPAMKELTTELNFFLQNRGLQDLDVNVRRQLEMDNASIKETIRIMSDKKTLVDILGTPLRMGDKGGILSFAPAFYMAQKTKYMAEGMSESDAKSKAALETWLGARETQQDTATESLGSIQKLGSIGRAMFLFRGTPMQMFRKWEGGVRAITTDRKSFKKAGRNLDAREAALRGVHDILFVHAQAALFSIVSSGFMGLFGREFEKEKVIRDSLLGPLSALPILGDTIGFFASKLFGLPTFGNSPIGGITGLQGAQDFLKDLERIKASWEKSIEKGENPLMNEASVDALVEVTTSFLEVATGKPAGNVYDLITRSVKFVNGDLQSPLAMIYSDYAMGVDTREVTFGMAADDKATQLKESVDRKELTSAEYNKQIDKEIRTIEKKFIKEVSKEMLTLEDTKDAVAHLDMKIRNGYIPENLRSQVIKEYNKVVDNFKSEDILRQGELEKLSEKNFIENTVLYAKALGADPVALMAAVLTKREQVASVEDGVVKMVTMPTKTREKLESNWEKANGKKGRHLIHAVPPELGGRSGINNLRFLTNAEASDVKEVQKLITSAFYAGKIKRKKARELAKDYMDMKITRGEVDQAIQ